MSGRTLKFSSGIVVLSIVVALTMATVAIAPTASGVPSVRGFDGKTVLVAGLGIGSQFAAADVGGGPGSTA